jgi:membrane fusion protein, copper/silver efflux system
MIKMNLTKREITIGVIGLLAGLFVFYIASRMGSPAHQHDHETTHTKSEPLTYTCSMHPQIRQAEPGKCPICGMDLIPLSPKNESSEDNSPFIHVMTPKAVALANIQTQKVKTADAEHEIYLTGKIAVNEQEVAVITANYAGRIEKLFVDFTGQEVKKGQKLATVYSPELITAQRELIEASKYKEVNPALYNAVREKLRLWKITPSQIDGIESKGEVLSELDVYADQTGVVVSRQVSKGDYVNKGSVMFEIADLSNVWVVLDAYESDLTFMRVGQKFTFTLTSIPGKEFTSTITFINPMIDPQTRTASIRAQAKNTDLLLKPEMFVKAKVTSAHGQIASATKSLVIPKTALLWTGKRSVVYVKVPDAEHPSFEMREISAATSSGDFLIVKNGLEEGEEIVVHGVFAIDAAAQLSGNYSMMNRPVDKRIPVPDQFQEQLTRFINNYFNLKNDLVEGNGNQVEKSVSDLQKSLHEIDMKLLSEHPRTVWMEHHKTIKKHVGQLTKAKNINDQRELLALLSEHLIETMEVFGTNLDTIYVDYCPMALNDKGAYWLSEFKEIKNPYFGDTMLKCGEVKQIISKKASQQSPGKKIQAEHQH